MYLSYQFVSRLRLSGVTDELCAQRLITLGGPNENRQGIDTRSFREIDLALERINCNES